MIGDQSRVVCCEILTNEKQETAAGFWGRANADNHGSAHRRSMGRAARPPAGLAFEGQGAGGSGQDIIGTSARD